MTTHDAPTIAELPEYHELIRKRHQIILPLAAVMFVAYFAFILLVAYDPSYLATPLADGVTSLGITLGLGLILLTFAVTALYTWYANAHIEDLIAEIQKKAGHE